ncbi:MAG: TrmH family RNA methyltransferase [Pseudomonadota bacterium]
MRIAVFQPDIALNLGAIIRLGVCFGAATHVIEPCGFPFSLKAVRRSALDYAEHADLHRWDSWSSFVERRPEGRLLLLTTQGATSLWAHRFASSDTLLLGRESAGAPPEVHEAADARLLIPIEPPARSLNIAMAAAIALAEWRRQSFAAAPRDP